MSGYGRNGDEPPVFAWRHWLWICYATRLLPVLFLGRLDQPPAAQRGGIGMAPLKSSAKEEGE
jgi:hypothetical protein